MKKLSAKTEQRKKVKTIRELGAISRGYTLNTVPYLYFIHLFVV